jgi:hypothetical protein
MKQRIPLPTVLASAVIAVACLSVLVARDAPPSNWKSLETNYAQANVELAKARIAMADRENAEAPGTIPKETMDILRTGLLLTQDRLQQLQANTTTDSFASQIIAAEGTLQALEVNHSESLKANQLQAGAVPDVNLRGEVAEIELAKSKLALLKGLAKQPPEVRIDSQIRFLQDDIIALWARPLRED